MYSLADGTVIRTCLTTIYKFRRGRRGGGAEEPPPGLTLGLNGRGDDGVAGGDDF